MCLMIIEWKTKLFSVGLLDEKFLIRQAYVGSDQEQVPAGVLTMVLSTK